MRIVSDKVEDASVVLYARIKQSPWRALRFARTEVISGYADGDLEG